MANVVDYGRLIHLKSQVPDASMGVAPRMRLSHQFEQHRMQEAMKLAEESDFYVNVTPEYLLSRHADQHAALEEADRENMATDWLQEVEMTDKAKEERRQRKFDMHIRELRYVNLTNSCLRQVGAVEFCRSLTVLVMPGNYLSSLEPLGSCRMLRKLDVSRNHLESLPGMTFWGGFRHLQQIFLHDNPLGRSEAVMGLLASPQLSVLTLFDTPLSLKRNYRHHMINSIWTLKLLDKRVVADEEIIEDLNIAIPRYQKDAPVFFVNPYPQLPQQQADTLETHLNSIVELNHRLNFIMKHHSPVLVIQRWIRGHLTRIHLGKRPSRAKAASKKSTSRHQRKQSRSYAPRQLEKIVEMPATAGGAVSDRSVPARDEDEGHRVPQLQINVELLTKESVLAQLNEGGSQSLELRRWNQEKKSDVDELESQTWRGPSTPIGTPTPLTQAIESLRAKQWMANEGGMIDKAGNEEIGYKSPRYAFLDELRLPTEQQLTAMQRKWEAETDTEIPFALFRLQGRKETIDYLDANVDLMWRKTHEAELIRQAEEDYHVRKLKEPPPQLSEKAKTKPVTDDQRCFQRNHGTMSLWLLQKWDATDREVALMERGQHLAQQVQDTKLAHTQAKYAVDTWKHERQNWAQVTRQRERHHAANAIHTQKELTAKEHKLKQQQRAREVELRSFQRQNRQFAQSFRSQQTMVSNALMRHDSQTLKEDRVAVRADKVSSTRQAEQEQMSEIRRYLDQQRLLRQAEIAAQRSHIENAILQDANERHLEARVRVEHLRNVRRMVQGLPAPPITTFPEVPTLREEDFADLDNWSARILVQAGRVGKHPSQRGTVE